jgi:hypothetical protein
MIAGRDDSIVAADDGSVGREDSHFTDFWLLERTANTSMVFIKYRYPPNTVTVPKTLSREREREPMPIDVSTSSAATTLPRLTMILKSQILAVSKQPIQWKHPSITSATTVV